MEFYLLFPIANSNTNYTIPNSVTKIYAFAFENCTGLTSIIIENSLSTISDSSFKMCSELTKGNVIIYQNPNDPNSTKDIWVNGSKITVTLDTTIADKLTPINNGTATLADYTSAGITGVTDDNINTVNEAISNEIVAQNLKLLKSQIQAVVDKVTKLPILKLTRTENALTRMKTFLLRQIRKVRINFP